MRSSRRTSFYGACLGWIVRPRLCPHPLDVRRVPNLTWDADSLLTPGREESPPIRTSAGSVSDRFSACVSQEQGTEPRADAAGPSGQPSSSRASSSPLNSSRHSGHTSICWRTGARSGGSGVPACSSSAIRPTRASHSSQSTSSGRVATMTLASWRSVWGLSVICVFGLPVEECSYVLDPVSICLESGPERLTRIMDELVERVAIGAEPLDHDVLGHATQLRKQRPALAFREVTVDDAVEGLNSAAAIGTRFRRITDFGRGW